MKKIAKPEELQAKLQSLLDYASRRRPHRRVLARRLLRLADAVEGKTLKTAGRVQYHATPYDPSKEGFYFRDHRDFEKKWREAKKQHGTEEYEIQFIDGPRALAQLFEAAQVNQANLEEWDDLADESDWWPAAYYMLSIYGERDLRKVMQRVEDVMVMEGDAKEYAYESVEGQGGPSELGKDTLEMYFDWDSYARDLELNGDVQEFRFGGKEFTVDVHSF